MVSALLNFLLLLVLVRSVFPEDPKLQLTAIVYRHGDRTPVGTFPTDKYDESYWLDGWGQLTNLGKNQMFELGEYLRRRYINFLPLEYNEDDISVVSTNYSRTLMSAYSNLAGLYKPVGDDIWNKKIKWQPIPVRLASLDIKDEGAFQMCDKYQESMGQVLSSEEFRIWFSRYEEVFQNLAVLTGLDFANPTDVFINVLIVHDALFIEHRYGLKLPDWAADYFPQPLGEIANFVFLSFAYNKPQQRLACGSILQHVIDLSDQKIKGSVEQKMWQFSGHDATLSTLMQCLNIYDGERPPYASTLIYELYELDKQYYIVISYKVGDQVRVLKLPECDLLCPFDIFKNIVQPLIPENFESECANSLPKINKKGKY